MQNARVLRVSSTRDVCIFCATRQQAAEGIYSSIPSPALSQRRHLNSSRKAPQYAAEVQVYKEEAQSLTPAQRQRQALLAQQYAPKQSQSSYSSPAERQRAILQSQFGARTQAQQAPYPARPQMRHSQRQSAPEPRLAANRGRNSNLPRQNPINLRPVGSLVRRTIAKDLPDMPNSRLTSRYRINMSPSTPPVLDTPQFGFVGHLRRRNGPKMNTVSAFSEREQTPQYPPRPSPIRKLDSAELDRLLSLGSKPSTSEVSKPYARITRETSASIICFYCGKEGHMSKDCSEPPPVRRLLRKSLRQEESVAEAAEEWIRKQGSKKEKVPAIQKTYEEERRRPEDALERRRARFRIDDEADFSPRETRNKYEDPEPRRREKGDRRARGSRIIREEDEDEEYVDRAERKRQRKEAKKKVQMAKAEPTPVYLPEYISVANLASVLKLRVEDFVRKLEELGFEDVQNDHILNSEHAGLIAQEYNFEPIVQPEEADEDLYPAPAPTPEDYANLPSRPPVVTIMGHVDHGKTTILDYMRSSSVAVNEFGGITQHIGAFSVPLASGKKITFLDTPGHSAFETMRARGANVTDIVVLVVAADDSVKPQTVEAIKHAQAANVPIIVAINKIDKEQANPERVKQDLARHGIEVEDFGGDTQTVCMSGKTGQGIPDLEEAISTLSEILDHRADPEASVEGWVLEGTTKKSGRVATVLVRSGTLRPGDILVAGTTWTRVRSLRNEAGVAVQEVGPGMPVEVDGWREQPVAGDEVLQAPDEQKASAVAELRTEMVEREQMAKDMEAINESRRLEAQRREAEEAAAKAAENGDAAAQETIKESGPEIISFIVKADVSGSVEAVVDSISSIGNNEVGIRILRSGVGSPSEFDVQYAADANGHIANFNTTIPPNIAAMAEEKGVKILDSNIIYRVVESVKGLLSEKLAPRITQRVTGEAEIAAVFEIGLGGKKKLRVAGSKVRNGVVVRGNKVRVYRKEEVVFDGTLSSLKNQKKDVDQMRKDTECGIAFDGWEEFEVGDKIQCYEEKSENRSL